MAGSYKKINYALRPAKSVERKMLVAALAKLSHFEQLELYKYIGFGSPFFSDFILFHKSLGIKEMISIEHDEHYKNRFKFNIPFRCIQLKFGHSTEVLPELNWDKKVILWLDYDDPLDREALTDMSSFCRKAQPGSVIIITVNAQPRKKKRERYEEFVERIGEDKVPLGTKPDDLADQGSDWKLAKLYHRIIKNEIKQLLSKENGGRTGEAKLRYKQLLHFHYRDSSKMLTVGGLMYTESQLDILQKCHFERLPFIRSGDRAYRIEIPILTYREIRYLDKHLPLTRYSEIDSSIVSEEDMRKYARIYRYFPLFTEAEM